MLVVVFDVGEQAARGERSRGSSVPAEGGPWTDAQRVAKRDENRVGTRPVKNFSNCLLVLYLYTFQAMKRRTQASSELTTPK